MEQKAVSKVPVNTNSSDEFLNFLKGILLRVPEVQWLLKLKGKFKKYRNRIRELSALIQEKEVVIFPSYHWIREDDIITHNTVQVLVNEWLDLYGVVSFRNTTLAKMDLPKKVFFLYIPQSFLRIPSSHENYLAQVGCKTRNMIRKSEKNGYEYKEFNWNEHLHEIFEINTSKEIRQEEQMRGWYREPVQPRYHSQEEIRYRKYYGGFKNGKLYAYLHFWVCEDIAIIKHIIGHAQHLQNGIMNGLISYTVQKCIENCQVKWLYYGRYEEGSSLSSFKKHAGFQKFALALDLGADEELRKFARHRIRTWWRS